MNKFKIGAFIRGGVKKKGAFNRSITVCKFDALKSRFSANKIVELDTAKVRKIYKKLSISLEKFHS